MHGVHGVCFFWAFVVEAAFGCEAPHCNRVEIMSKEAFLFLLAVTKRGMRVSEKPCENAGA